LSPEQFVLWFAQSTLKSAKKKWDIIFHALFNVSPAEAMTAHKNERQKNNYPAVLCVQRDNIINLRAKLNTGMLHPVYLCPSYFQTDTTWVGELKCFRWIFEYSTARC